MKKLYYFFVLLLFIPPFLFGAEIHDAVLQGDIQRVRNMLFSDPKQIRLKEEKDIITDSDKMAQYKQLLQVNLIFRKKKPYVYPSLKGYTPLMLSIITKNEKMVELLLSFAANVNDKSPEGLTAIHLGSIVGDKDILLSLLKQKYAVSDARDDYGFTPLMISAALNNPDTLEVFLGMKQPVNIKDSNDITPLMYASLVGNLRMVDGLVNAGANINTEDKMGNTALMYASFYGDTGLIAYLLNLGAKIDVENKNGLTPLLYAAISGEQRTLEYLLQKGANRMKTLRYAVSIEETNRKYPKGAGLLRIANINHDENMINYLLSEY